MSGVAKHEKASRNAKPRRRCLRLRSPVADLFEQRQIACRLTDNRINGCSSLSSSSSSFSPSRFRFPARLFLKEVPQVVEEPLLHLRGYFYVPFSTLPLSRRPVFLFSSSPFEPRDEWRMVRKGWNPRGRLCPSQRKEDYKVGGKS